MDILTSSPRKLFFKYLIASIGSGLVVSIYSSVDTIAIGQSEGDIGAAAMAVILPVFSIIIFFGILIGIGGGVLFSSEKARGQDKTANMYFTVALILAVSISVILWLVFFFFEKQILFLFGSTEELYPTVHTYAKWIIWFLPMYVLPYFLAAFLRNDNAPNLAFAAVIIGGIINIIGDYYFVFPLGLKIEGAAIATILGATVQFLVLLTHFLTRRNSLRIVRVERFWNKVKWVLRVGLGTGLVELGILITAILMNNQIDRYGDLTTLSVYGIIGSLSTLFVAIFGGIGQAEQPLVSSNFGAGNKKRVLIFWRYSAITALIVGAVIAMLGELFPNQIFSLFVATTPEALSIAPRIFRIYYISYFFMGFNIVSLYYLQSILRDNEALKVTVLRSLILSFALIVILPLLFGLTGLWTAVPLSELIIFVYVGLKIRNINKKLKETE